MNEEDSESGSVDEIEEESNGSDLENDSGPTIDATEENKKQQQYTPSKRLIYAEGDKSNTVIGLKNNIDDEDLTEMTSENESDTESDNGQDLEHESSSDSDESDSKISSLSEVNEQRDLSKDEKSGWADAMAKVLNMGKNTAQQHPNKPLFLSKAIKDSEIKHRSTANTKDLSVADIQNNQTAEENAPFIRAAVRRAQKKELDEKGRIKPNVIKDRANEKMLCKLATKGIVQLFNAVREQQKSIKSQLNAAGGSVRKREKVYKGMDRQSFINVLTNKSPTEEGNTSIISKTLKQKSSSSLNSHLSKKQKLQNTSNIKSEEDGIKEETLDVEDGSTWNVFRDDFMMGAKMKDWDKEESESDA